MSYYEGALFDIASCTNPRGSNDTTFLELGPQDYTSNSLLGPKAIVISTYIAPKP